MISTLLTKIIGSRNDRTLKALRKIVKTNQCDGTSVRGALSDQELQAKTAEYRQRLEQGETAGLLPERSPPSVKPPAVCSACVTSTSS